MVEIAPGWSLDVERGPDWLILTLNCEPDHSWDSPPLAESAWSLLEQNRTHRLLVDCSRLSLLNTWLIGQLVLLHKRIRNNGGVIRLCGLSDSNQQALHACRMDQNFPQYSDRTDAVMDHLPTKPR